MIVEPVHMRDQIDYKDDSFCEESFKKLVTNSSSKQHLEKCEKSNFRIGTHLLRSKLESLQEFQCKELHVYQ